MGNVSLWPHFLFRTTSVGGERRSVFVVPHRFLPFSESPEGLFPYYSGQPEPVCGEDAAGCRFRYIVHGHSYIVLRIFYIVLRRFGIVLGKSGIPCWKLRSRDSPANVAFRRRRAAFFCQQLYYHLFLFIPGRRVRTARV